jgi:hypothetical protein
MTETATLACSPGEALSMDFWKDAKRTPVTWKRNDPRLHALMAETRFPGLYALAAGELVLKVGTAGYIRKGISRPNTVAARLEHHLRKVNRASHPAWWQFTDALGGRDLTIYTLCCEFPMLTPKEAHWRRRELEDAVIREAKARRGGVLWEEMEGRERNDRPVTPGRKYPRVLVEPDAVRRRLLAELELRGGPPNPV